MSRIAKIVAKYAWIVALLSGLLAGLIAAFFAGENPIHVLMVMTQAVLATPYDLGMTLVYSTPLLFTGLSVAVAYRAGLFNLGAEGQLEIGALAATIVALGFEAIFPEFVSSDKLYARIFGVVMCGSAAALAGGAVGWLIGVLRVRRGSHEVVTSIMLNFLLKAFATWIVLDKIRSIDTQNPESRPVGQAFRSFETEGFGGAPLTIWFIVGILAAAFCAIVFSRTRAGFRSLVVGTSTSAAKFSGIDSGRQMIFAMTAAGAIAGFAGLGDVLAGAGRFRLGFSTGYGFTGIAVALLAGGRPLPVIGSAVLFGALTKGALDLDFETDHVTHDLALVIQGCIILFASSRWLQARSH